MTEPCLTEGNTALQDRLRIAQVTFACHRRGGVERDVYEFSKRLARDHDVHIFAGTNELACPGVTFHEVPEIRWPWVAYHLGFFATTSLALRRQHGRKAFDIVHVQGIPSAIHSDVTTAHSVHCIGTDRQMAAASPWERAWHRVRTVDPAMRWLTGYNFLPAHCGRVIAISEQVKRDVTTAFGVPPQKVEIIHNGVDVEAFSPGRRERARPTIRSRVGLSPDATVALFVGNEFQRKGLAVVLKALARFDPASRPCLLVVGDTRDPVLTLADCKRLAAELGIAPWIRFTGAVAGVEDYFAAADFLVLPTLYEPFGLVILEALATGLPAVFSRLAGAADVVRDRREAFLIENPADPDEVAALMRRLTEHPALRRQMGAKGRNTALNYSWDLVTERTLACYGRILAERRAAFAGRRATR